MRWERVKPEDTSGANQESRVVHQLAGQIPDNTGVSHAQAAITSEPVPDFNDGQRLRYSRMHK